MKKPFLWSLAVLLFGCGSEVAPDNGSDPPTLLTWQGSVSGTAIALDFTSVAATTETDAGVALSFSGKSSDYSVSVRIDIPGGLAVSVPSEGGIPLNIASAGINVSFDYAGTRFFGTRGTVTFTAYSPDPGGKVEGSVDCGLVTTSMASPQAASLTGDFSLIVTVPTPTPTPDP